MGLSHEILSVKLYHICHEYAKMQYHLDACRNVNLTELRESITRLKYECDKRESVLQNNVHCEKNSIVKALSKAQSEYIKKFSDISEDAFRRTIIDKSSEKNNNAEASILLAEYAIDFATMSVKQAMLAAMNAMCIEMEH